MADVPNSVFFASITDLSKRLRAKEFSCVELTRAFCDRFERVAPRYNAMALSLRDDAMRRAREVDDELKRDRTRGPLQGIPYGAKDLLAVAKHPTTWGARPYAAQVFDYDAAVIEKLDAQRAVLIGKLSMIELAGGGNYVTAGASLQGPTRNPWNRERWAGGSSSGSGAAVSAGLVTFAIGSETSGSILTPSAFCGVTGLRPTYGLVSRRGAMALSWTLDKLGPMCRSAEDCALVLAAISGGDSEDPGTAGKRFNYGPQFVRDPKEITIGYAPADFTEWPDAEARPAFEQALETIKRLGFQTKEVKLPDFPYGSVLSVILAGEAGAVFEDLIRSGKVDQLADARQAAGLKSYLDLPAVEYLRAQRVRAQIQTAFRDLLLDVNVLLAPTRYGVAPPINERLDRGGRTGAAPSAPGLTGIIPATNLAGLPALSLPCGFANGLPVAIQLVARPFYENQLVGIGATFQRETDWHKRVPPDAQPA